MPQRVGTGITEAIGIGCRTDAEGVHNQDNCPTHRSSLTPGGAAIPRALPLTARVRRAASVC